MVSCKKIIQNILSNKLSSACSDLKLFVDLPRNNSLSVSLCDVFRATCKCVLSLDKCSEEIQDLELITKLCLHHLKVHFIDDELKNYEFDRTLYFITRRFVELELYESAFFLAECLKDYLNSSLSLDENSNVIINNAYVIFWNAALQYEQCSNKCDKYDYGLQFRTIALDFCLMGQQCSEKLIIKVCITLQRYWLGNPNGNAVKCVSLFKRVWDQILMKKLYIYDRTIFFKLCYNFSSFWIRQNGKHQIFHEMISSLQDAFEKMDLNDEKERVMQVFIEIVKYCIKVFALKECVKVSSKSLTLWMMCLKASRTIEDTILSTTILNIFNLLFCEATRGLTSSIAHEEKAFFASVLSNINAWEFFVKEFLLLTEKLPDNSSSLSTSKIHASNAFIRFYICFLQNESDKKEFSKLLKKACLFIDLSLTSISSETLKTIEEQDAYINYGKVIGKLAVLPYKSSEYKEAVKLFEVSLEICSASTDEMSSLWSKQEMLIYSLMLSCDYNKALLAVVKALHLHEDKTKQCLELWIKIKRSVQRDKETSLFSKTIADAILQSGISFGTDRIIMLLVEELKYCKMDRCNMIEEILSTSDKLSSMPCNGIIKADVLSELVSTSLFVKNKSCSVDVQRSPVEMCQEAIQLYQNYLDENPDDNVIKLKLSVTYFWFHLVTFQGLYKIIEAELKESVPPPIKAVDPPTNDVDDVNDTCDIQPGIQFVTLSVETKALKNLDQAYLLWNQISQDSNCSWKDLSDTVDDLSILHIIQASAQIFYTSVHDLKQWKMSVLLLQAAIATNSKYHELSACTFIIKFALRLGYLKLAEHFVDHGLPLLSPEVISEKHKDEVLRFLVIQSNYCFHVEKFDEGLEVLQNVLTDPIFGGPKFKFTKLLQAETLLVLSQYLALPEIAYSNPQRFRSLCISSSHLNCAIDCATICLSLIKHESSDESRRSDVQRSDSMYYKPKLIHTFLVSHAYLGELCMGIGSPREARFYLQEALAVAQSHLLTYWCSKILTILGQLDLLCNSSKDCAVKLNGLQYIMKNELKENIAVILSKQYANKNVIDEHTSPEENFLITRSEQSLGRQMRQKFQSKHSDIYSSPSLKRKKTSVSKVYEFDRQGLYSLQLTKFEVSLLQSLQMITDGSVEEAIDDLEKILVEYAVVCKNITLTKEISLISLNCSQLAEDMFQRTPQSSDANIVINSAIHLASIYSSSGKFIEAHDHVERALSFLQSISQNPKFVYLNLYGLSKYQEVVASMKSLINAKKFISLEHQFFPISSQECSLPVMSRRVINPLIRTPPRGTAPKICVTDFSASNLCNAPVKKDTLPSYIKKDLALSSESIQLLSPSFQSVFFSSSSSEESVFTSPKELASDVKKTSQKRITRSNTVGDNVADDDTIKFKFFKSKSERANINSAGDIWRLPLCDQSSESVSSASKRISTTTSLSKKGSKQGKPSSKTKKGDSISKLTNAPQKKSRITNRIVKTKSEDYVLDSKRQFRNSRSIIKSSKTVERARSTSQNSKSDCSWHSSDEEVPQIDINSDISVDKVFGEPMHNPQSKEVFSLLNDLCNDFEAISVSNVNECGNNFQPNAASKELIKKTTCLLPDEKLLSFLSELTEIRSLLQHNPILPLYSNVCKLLALLTIIQTCQQDASFKDKTLNSGYLLSETFAITLRHQLMTTRLRKIKKGEEDLDTTLAASLYDGSSLPEKMESMLNSLPEDFTIVQISTFPEREPAFDCGRLRVPKVVLCQYRKNSLPVICCIDRSEDDKFTSSLFVDFEDIQQQSVLIMSNKDTKVWWKSRIALDRRLKVVSENMENVWMGCWKGLLLGIPTCEEVAKKLQEATDAILQLAPTENKDLVQILIDSARFLRRHQITEAICYLWNCTPADDIYFKLFSSISNMSSALKECERHPVILILDKDIQNFPWECMPILRDRPVSRVPSMSLLLYRLALNCSHNDGVDSSQTFYILNPSGDLISSQERFEDQFERQCTWKGVVGRTPTSKEFTSALEDHEIFLYCGHGTGRSYLEGTPVDKLRCKAATVLMGCSSGHMKQLGRQLETCGIAVRYWLSGSPCVIANLWNVTDKDIDKFTQEFLSMWVPNYKNDDSTTYDSAKATSVSRKVCKLQYLIGAAPVVYGLPVVVRK